MSRVVLKGPERSSGVCRSHSNAGRRRPNSDRFN